MKLAKYIHACVLIEDDDSTILLDPGEFTWKAGVFSIDSLEKLDAVVITHEHLDHFSPDFVKAIVEAFPAVKIYTTSAVCEQLENLGITNTSSTSEGDIDIAPLAHESMEPLAGAPCDNIRLHYKGILSHPGDSHHLTETKEILLLPIAGPWGATIDAVRMAATLKPKVVVPIHDWMWNDEWRQTMYERMETFFKTENITFIQPVTGKSFEVPA